MYNALQVFSLEATCLREKQTFFCSRKGKSKKEERNAGQKQEFSQNYKVVAGDGVEISHLLMFLA